MIQDFIKDPFLPRNIKNNAKWKVESATVAVAATWLLQEYVVRTCVIAAVS